MHRPARHTLPSIRFRRWNRKAYAAFCSLGRQVTIGHVCRGIVEASRAKAKRSLRLMPPYGAELQPATDEPPCGAGDACPPLAGIAPVVTPVAAELPATAARVRHLLPTSFIHPHSARRSGRDGAHPSLFVHA